MPTDLCRRAAARFQSSFLTRLATRPASRERGQATTEYVLLLLGVAAIALAVVGWATRTGKIGELLDRVLDSIAGRAT